MNLGARLFRDWRVHFAGPSRITSGSYGHVFLTVARATGRAGAVVMVIATILGASSRCVRQTLHPYQYLTGSRDDRRGSPNFPEVQNTGSGMICPVGVWSD
jgi:hypothetical protein